MTKSFNNFEIAIGDAKDLIESFDIINATPDRKASEALKRAALVMTVTAWETYIEDVAMELFNNKFSVVKGSHIGNYIHNQLHIQIKCLHNPDSIKVKKLFVDFLDFDVTEKWTWANYHTPELARMALNKWLNRRGEAVHRAQIDMTKTDLVKRDEVDKCIRFFTELATITDKALSAI